jgi:hypothetical protein
MYSFTVNVIVLVITNQLAGRTIEGNELYGIKNT